VGIGSEQGLQSWWQSPDSRFCVERSLSQLNEYGMTFHRPGRPAPKLVEAVAGLADFFASRLKEKEPTTLSLLRAGLERPVARRWFAGRVRRCTVDWISACDSDHELRQMALAGDDRLKGILEDFVHALFDFPSRRLATYGTLKTGGPNHYRVRDLGGTWSSGALSGRLSNRGWGASYGSAGAQWDSASSDEIAVEVLESRKLSKAWDCLDSFEGPDYKRIWVPIDSHSGLRVCNLYAVP
jgi:gamma-glutamylcyclotransferase (GGCT)/AIG2-like uncharacterized protein YtfP